MKKHLCNGKNNKLNEELVKEYLDIMEQNSLKAIKICGGNNIEKRKEVNKLKRRVYY